MLSRPWRVIADGVLLIVRLTPRASREDIEGIGALSNGERVLRVRVRAAPDKGAANEALLRLMSDRTGLPRARVALHGGAAARLKTVALRGDPVDLIARLEAAWGLQS